MIYCSKCNSSQEDFSHWGYAKEREIYICPSCKKARKQLKLKEYREKNTDKIAKQRQEYRKIHKERLCEESKKYYHQNREKKLAQRKLARLDPNSAYYQWNLKNREKARLAAKEYRKKEGFYERNWLYTQKRKKEDVHFMLSVVLRSQVSSLIKNLKKSDQTIPLLGCSISEFKNHLESTWQEGMSWENYGRNGWHIDHIRPRCTFDLSLEEDQRVCFHYTNLRALWAKDNLSRPKDGSDLFDQFNN